MKEKNYEVIWKDLSGVTGNNVYQANKESYEDSKKTVGYKILFREYFSERDHDEFIDEDCHVFLKNETWYINLDGYNYPREFVLNEKNKDAIIQDFKNKDIDIYNLTRDDIDYLIKESNCGSCSTCPYASSTCDALPEIDYYYLCNNDDDDDDEEEDEE